MTAPQEIPSDAAARDSPRSAVPATAAGEWGFLLAWPWFLAAVVAWTQAGAADDGRGRAAAENRLGDLGM